MAASDKASADRSVSIGGNVRQSAIVTGHSNAITMGDIEFSLPAPQNVDISHELISIRRILEDRFYASTRALASRPRSASTKPG